MRGWLAHTGGTRSHSHRLKVRLLTPSLQAASTCRMPNSNLFFLKCCPMVAGCFETGKLRVQTGPCPSEGRSQPCRKKATSRTPDGKMPGESRSSPREIQNYLGRISGPLLDRIDLHIEVPQVQFREDHQRSDRRRLRANPRPASWRRASVSRPVQGPAKAPATPGWGHAISNSSANSTRPSLNC